MTGLSRLIGFAVALGTLSAPAAAQFAANAEPQTEISSATDTVPSAFNSERLTESALKVQAGREDTALIAQSESTATVTRNSIGDNSQTGEVRVADQAFQNLSGLSLLNINTGNNVAINASMNVNISITPGQ